ncbi:MAG: hypothetical protein QM715_06385 [Nibricoccus sp.]
MHPLDYIILAAYLLLVLGLGWRAASANRTEEGYYLAGRKLGKWYQIFFNFGNATEPQGAVSTASFVYERGASGVWYSFQTVFMNPYYWFMNVWFRRARVLTVADMFVERFGSRPLAQFYALFQVGVTVLTIGFGCFTAYTITATIVTKPAAAWTAEEQTSVANYQEWSRLEHAASTGALGQAAQDRLAVLRDMRAAGRIDSGVSLLKGGLAKPVFYLSFVVAVAAYMVLGGLKAAALNEAAQSLLIVAFSVVLIPVGLHAVGGWGELGKRVPREMFNLFGGKGAVQFTGWTIFAITLASVVQVNALSSNMNIMGSARTEFAARVGVAGFYAKRVMVMLWTLTGLIAVALFSGEGALPFSDAAWGTMARQLLGPGLMGLMLVGLVAGVMSNVSAKAMATASLFVQNFCRPMWPTMDEAERVRLARWTIVAVLVLGAFCAGQMSGMEAVVRLVIMVNVPFGAAIMLMLFWRRLTAKAVWVALIGSITLNLVLPLTLPNVAAVRQRPELLRMASEAGGGKAPVYFDAVAHSVPGDLASPLEGRGRLNIEVFLLSKLGVDVERFGSSGRLAAQFLWDVAFPFVILIMVSLVTHARKPEDTALFFGKMKTPVGETTDQDTRAMEATRAEPHRFDAQKLLGPNSSWEFTRWNRVDLVGFAACCVLSGGMIAAFCLLLRWAAG